MTQQHSHQHTHKVLILSSRFRHPERRLFFSKARLFPDRIELSGWDLTEKYCQEIRLDTVQRVCWSTEGAEAGDVELRLDDGQIVRLTVTQPKRWKRSLEQRMRWRRPDRYPVNASSTSPDLSLRDLALYSTSMG